MLPAARGAPCGSPRHASSPDMTEGREFADPIEVLQRCNASLGGGSRHRASLLLWGSVPHLMLQRNRIGRPLIAEITVRKMRSRADRPTLHRYPDSSI